MAQDHQAVLLSKPARLQDAALGKLSGNLVLWPHKLAWLPAADAAAAGAKELHVGIISVTS